MLTNINIYQKSRRDCITRAIENSDCKQGRFNAQIKRFILSVFTSLVLDQTSTDQTHPLNVFLPSAFVCPNTRKVKKIRIRQRTAKCFVRNIPVQTKPVSMKTEIRIQGLMLLWITGSNMIYREWHFSTVIKRGHVCSQQVCVTNLWPVQKRSRKKK